MARPTMTMKAGNKGLTVRVNLFPLKLEKTGTYASFVMKGVVTNADTKVTRKWNHPGELLLILGKWNADKHRSRK
jgi:hypothetical protein